MFTKKMKRKCITAKLLWGKAERSLDQR